MGTASSIEEYEELGTAPTRPIVGGPTKSELINQPESNLILLNNGVKNESFKRNFRNAVMGRRLACRVGIDKNGFKLSTIKICEGQIITFKWIEQDRRFSGFVMTQMIFDGEILRPVPGGITSDFISKENLNFFELQLNLKGFYRFGLKIKNQKIDELQCNNLSIEVHDRRPVEAKVIQNRFVPEIIRIDEGNCIEWKFEDCSIEHSLIEIHYSHRLGNFIRFDKDVEERNVGTLTKQYDKPGIFYLQNNSNDICIIHVRDRQREYAIEVSECSFSQPFLQIEQGDRVWWGWDDRRVKRPHCLYEIEPPSVVHNDGERYLPKPNGFNWPYPTKRGLLSHEFNEPGVYYYSDYYGDNLHADYIGTIIVTPKSNDHWINVSATRQFVTGLQTINIGDRIWFTWALNHVQLTDSPIREITRSISLADQRSDMPCLEEKYSKLQSETFITDALIENKIEAKVDCIRFQAVGVYQYKLPGVINACSVLCKNGPRNHTIYVTENGFEPNCIYVYPFDRIWWLWENSNIGFNVVQVSQSGDIIADGFFSGAPVRCQSAFVHQFKKIGCFYYVSTTMSKFYGSIVVERPPEIHQVSIQLNGNNNFLSVDPIVINLNDVVAWTFQNLQAVDISLISTVEQLEKQNFPITKFKTTRFCTGRSFNQLGMFNYTSDEFFHPTNYKDRISSVLVDKIKYKNVIRLDLMNFYPNEITIMQGECIHWTWEESNQSHNIFSINGPSVFVSKDKPERNSSFLYTFEKIGKFQVASKNCQNHCFVQVVQKSNVIRTERPRIVTKISDYSIDKTFKIKLSCNTPNSTIYYTLDGSMPELCKVNNSNDSSNIKEYLNVGRFGKPRKYDMDNGIVFRRSGISFIRAIAVCKGQLNSYVFTSKRFWVCGEDRERIKLFVPKINLECKQSGIIHIWWDEPSPEMLKYVKNFTVSFNSIDYGRISPKFYSLIAAGIAGGRNYEIQVKVTYKHTRKIRTSNKLQFQSKKKIKNDGLLKGPLISLEMSDDPKNIVIVWRAIQVKKIRIRSYVIYVNGQKYKTVKDEIQDRFREIIENCKENIENKIHVSAIDAKGIELQSNELEVTIPLDYRYIELPIEDDRKHDGNLYKEYIEVFGDSQINYDYDDEPIDMVENLDSEDEEIVDEIDVVSLQSRKIDNLPVPVIEVNKESASSILVSWTLDYYQHEYGSTTILKDYIVHVVGNNFQNNVNSKIQTNCKALYEGKTFSAVHHQFHAPCFDNRHQIDGLKDGEKYYVFVTARYEHIKNQVESNSEIIVYTTTDPPSQPTLYIEDVGLYNATLCWKDAKRNGKISSYQFIVDGKPIEKFVDAGNNRTNFNMNCGETKNVQVQTIYEKQLQSRPSNRVKITCPNKPASLNVFQMHSDNNNAIVIGWKSVSAKFYRVFLNGEMVIETVSESLELKGLNDGERYKVSVRAYLGQTKVDRKNEVTCLVESDDSSSNQIIAFCPNIPSSSSLRILEMNDRGIIVGWEKPNEFCNDIKAYQIIRDHRIDQQVKNDRFTALIENIEIGKEITLQLLALTDRLPTLNQPIDLDKVKHLNGFIEFTNGTDNYKAYKPGNELIIRFQGLKSIVNIMEEKYKDKTMVSWKINNLEEPYCLNPEKYKVEWSCDSESFHETTDDKQILLRTNPNKQYKMIIKTYRICKIHDYTYKMKGKSTLYKISAQPPEIVDLKVLEITRHSIQISWSPLKNKYDEIIDFRVDACPINNESDHSFQELAPTVHDMVLGGLKEKTNYRIVVTAVTSKYFDTLPEIDERKRTKRLDKNRFPPNSSWLPQSQVVATTAGVDDPTMLKVTKIASTCAKLSWKKPAVYGPTKRSAYYIFYAPIKVNDIKEYKSVKIEGDTDIGTVYGLKSGSAYKLFVECLAVYGNNEVRSRSQIITITTSISCLPPEPYVTGFSTRNIEIAWQKPVLYALVNGAPVKLRLQCYRLEINGKPRRRIPAHFLKCTLTECKAGSVYKIVLVAMTCTDQVYRERKLMIDSGQMQPSKIFGDKGLSGWKPIPEDDQSDESPSKPLYVRIPIEMNGMLANCQVEYVWPEGETDTSHMRVSWNIQGSTSVLKNVQISWIDCDKHKDARMVDPTTTEILLPISKRRQIVDIKVKPIFIKESTITEYQIVQCLIPGCPDAPFIYIKSIQSEEFSIEWFEPKLWTIKIKGYQLYLENKKVGGMLKTDHRRAIVPCCSNKTYKVELQALSDNDIVGDSELSNTLKIKIDSLHSPHPPDFLPLKVTNKTDTTISLSWAGYVEPNELHEYLLSWDSGELKVEENMKIMKGQKTFVIRKLLPRSQYDITLLAYDNSSNILFQSKRLKNIETSGVPDTPIVRLRVVNFDFITIEWCTPRIFGGAVIESYKIYVNGVVQEILPKDHLTYTFTRGQLCCEYAFQVQAITGSERFDSRPSDPLIVIWPGVLAPTLKQITLPNEVVKIYWSKPKTTEGAEISHYRLVYVDESGHVEYIDNLQSDTTFVELKDLQLTNYQISLEIYLKNSPNNIVKSKSVFVCLRNMMEAPVMTVKIIGLEERRKIQQVACDLINRRDKCLNAITDANQDASITDELKELTRIDEMLDDCLSSLKRFTGEFHVEINWCLKSYENLVGVNLLINSKQYCEILKPYERRIKIRLKTNVDMYRLSLVALSKTQISPESNVIEILSKPFKTFQFWTYFDRCSSTYRENLAAERHQAPNLIINVGLIKRQHQLPDDIYALNLFGNSFEKILENRPRLPTVFLFWALPNKYSVTCLEWFLKFARKRSAEFQFVSVAKNLKDFNRNDREELVRIISESGLKDDANLRHFLSVTANDPPTANLTLKEDNYSFKHDHHDPNCKFNHKHENVYGDIATLLGVLGSPTIVIVNSNNYVEWKGRYCAYDYQSFDSFLTYILRQNLNSLNETDKDPWNTEIDMRLIDTDTFNTITNTNRGWSAPYKSNTTTVIRVPSANNVNNKRKRLGNFFEKKQKSKIMKRLSVENRPFSASSPYTQKLLDPYHLQILNKLKKKQLKPKTTHF